MSSTFNQQTTTGGDILENRGHDEETENRLVLISRLSDARGESCSLLGEVLRVWVVEWHPTEDILASCSNKEVRIWAPENQLQACNIPKEDNSTAWPWECRAVFGGVIHTRTIRSVAFTHQGDRLAAASFDSTVSIWKARSADDEGVHRSFASWTCVAIVEGHTCEVKSASWSPCGNFLVTCSRDRTAWVHERTQKAQDAVSPVDAEGTEKCENSEDYYCTSILSGHGQDLKQVAWHPMLDLIATASYDETVKLWTRRPADDEWYQFQSLNQHHHTVWSLSFSPNGNQLVTGCDDLSLRTFTCQEVESVTSSYTGNDGVSVSKSWFIDPMFRRRLHTADLSSGASTRETAPASIDTGAADYRQSAQWKELQQYHNDKCTWNETDSIPDAVELNFYCVDWHPRENIIATGSGANSIQVLQPSQALSPGSRVLEQFGIDCSATAVAKWEPVATRERAHGNDINCVKWRKRKDGITVLASASDDGLISLWVFKPRPLQCDG